MPNIYTAIYVCRSVKESGMPGYNDVTLGLQGGNRSTDITVKGTLARFVEGKEYIIQISET